MEAAEATDGVCSGAVAASEECLAMRGGDKLQRKRSRKSIRAILWHFKSHGDVVRFFADSREVPSRPG